MIMWIFWLLNAILITEILFYFFVKYSDISESFNQCKIISIFLGSVGSLLNNMFFFMSFNKFSEELDTFIDPGTIITVQELFRYELCLIGLLISAFVGFYLFIKINKKLYKLYGGK